MTLTEFSDVSCWVFDLDNTLYHPSARLFDQIEVKMTDFVMQTTGKDRKTADYLRSKYWADHGTTLAGLMKEHQVDPLPYLTWVHDIDLSHLEPDPELAARISALPGRKIIYTNGSAPYARNVASARGLDDVFDGVFGVEDADFHPKPMFEAFDILFEKAGVPPQSAAMFEDEPRNLKVPHELGLRTVHVHDVAQEAPHIHFSTDNLSGFLGSVLKNV